MLSCGRVRMIVNEVFAVPPCVDTGRAGLTLTTVKPWLVTVTEVTLMLAAFDEKDWSVMLTATFSV
jgi:hypothetical protein